MDKTVLIAGKDFPLNAAYIAHAEKLGCRVMTSLSPDASNPAKISERSQSFVWHRSSPVSARSFVLQTETAFKRIDYVFLIFDTASYVKEFAKADAKTLSCGMDVLFLGYMHLCTEVLNRFLKQGVGNLCFILEKHPDLTEAAKARPRFFQSVPPAGPLVAAAGSAFKTFAENIAVQYADMLFGIHLIEGAADSELEKSAAEKVSWLFSYLETAPLQVNPKYAARWVSFGSKPSTGWKFFGN